MRISTVAFVMILTTVFLSACSSEKMAAVDDHGGNFYSKHGVLSLASVGGGATVMSAPVASIISQETASAPVAAPNTAPFKTAATWQWPVNGKVTETFGQKSEGVTNEGIVIAAAEGTPIKAARAGEVAFVGHETKTYGNIVILRHADGSMSAYSHARDISVTKGDRIAGGAVIGTVGQSGNAKTPQLHFAVRESGTSIDPMMKLPHNVAMNN